MLCKPDARQSGGWIVEFSVAVCWSLRGGGPQTNRIRILLHCLCVFMNCKNLVTIENQMFVFYSYNKTN